MKWLALLSVFFIASGFLNEGDSGGSSIKNDPDFLLRKSVWAEQTLAELSLDQKIGQLFMVAAYSNQGTEHRKKIEKLIKEQHIGGLIFFQGGPVREINLTNRYQLLSKVPLLISMDAEWGLAMRIDSTQKYPWQMTLGAIQNDSLIFEMGKQIGEQCKRVGIHVNLAPVVDVNVNPKNPVINARSFGEDRENVARKGKAYMDGMQSVRVMANAKHFPGHGDTDKDSHKTLPIISHDTTRLDSIELYPFKQLIGQGLASMMIAHLYIPAYEKTANTATTLSKKVVTNLLQKKLGFNGLIFTDALNMKGVSSYFKPGEVDLKAFLAGNDVLLYPADVQKGINAIKNALKTGEVTEEEINRRCLKILKAKEWVKVHKFKLSNKHNVNEDLNQSKYEYLNSKLAEAALTVVKNDSAIIPILDLKNQKIACVTIGDFSSKEFTKTLQKYGKVDVFKKEANVGQKLLDTLKGYHKVIVSIHKSDASPWKSYKISGFDKDFIEKISIQNETILTVFANAYSLSNNNLLDKVDGAIVAYQNGKYFQSKAAQLIFGGVGATGKLPVTINAKYPVNYGLDIAPIGRFEYTMPEDVDIKSSLLRSIDTIAQLGIDSGAYPGCQVFIAKNGKVIYDKAFGYHTYKKKRAVKTSDIYDLASITKIAASTFSLMKLQDEGKFDLDGKLEDYLADFLPEKSPYRKLNHREMLAHTAGLQAWIPFYVKTLSCRVPRYDIYSKVQSETYGVQVARNLYIDTHYPDSIYARILRGPLKEKKYKYSDLGYYFFLKIIERQSGKKMEDYTGELYADIGMSTSSYLPLSKFSEDRIPPTENDRVFRKQVIKGYVHDPGAAMMGGVGGHAGLFSNANDLAKLMQMLINGGTYGGKSYLKPETIKEYTSCQFCDDHNRRGAGFDKPKRYEQGGTSCNCVSLESFGHSGFTGTLTWADPDEEVVYVFLSNRVYPSAENKKLLHMNIRTRIQEEIYNAIRGEYKRIQEDVSDGVKE